MEILTSHGGDFMVCQKDLAILFPADGPILVITDAWIDRIRIKREHAYLIPAGAVLPFPARGPVFRFS